MTTEATSSLFDQPAKGANVPEYSVAEISQAVKRQIEGEFGHVRVKGEVTQPKLHSSGHLYLTLKDEGAVLAAVCWRGQVSRLKVKVEEGMEVVATGRLTTYPGQSKYQLVIEQMALAGIGALLKMLDERRKKLAAEGLFDEKRKKPLPYMPRVIGVITSPTGAVIKDILHRLADRFPVRVLVWPVAVQGDNAAAQVAGAITGFNALDENDPVPRPDVLIVARGGGSLEDLLAFHEEVVVRAAAASRIPLISAVGHETDTTLIDYASDRRAPTPTAAAEMAVPVRRELQQRVNELAGLLDDAWARRLELQRGILAHHVSHLTHPRQLIENLTQKLDERTERMVLAITNHFRRQQDKTRQVAAGLSLTAIRQNMRHGGEKLAQFSERMRVAMARITERRAEQMKGLGQLLETLSYNSILKRGFALVRDKDGVAVTRAGDVKAGAKLDIVFADGSKPVTADK